MNRFVEFLWPTLRKWTPTELAEILESQRNDIDQTVATVWDTQSGLALEAARRLFDSEEDRLRTTEGKASTYVLFAAAVIPLLAAVDSFVWEDKPGTAPRWIGASLLILAVIYLVCAGWWAFRTLRVGVYSRVDLPELLQAWRGADPSRVLITQTLIASRRNREEVNEKVSRVKMAHEFMVRAFVAFGLLVVVEAAWGIWHSIDDASVSEERAAKKETANSIAPSAAGQSRKSQISPGTSLPAPPPIVPAKPTKNFVPVTKNPIPKS